MKTLEKRFKIVALAILNNEFLSQLENKIEIVADAIDSGFPKAIKMVEWLENEVVRMSDSYSVMELN